MVVGMYRDVLGDDKLSTTPKVLDTIFCSCYKGYVIEIKPTILKTIANLCPSTKFILSKIEGAQTGPVKGGVRRTKDKCSKDKSRRFKNLLINTKIRKEKT